MTRENGGPAARGLLLVLCATACTAKTATSGPVVALSPTAVEQPSASAVATVSPTALASSAPAKPPPGPSEPPPECVPPASPKPNGLIPASELEELQPERNSQWGLVAFNAALGQGLELREGEPPGANCAVTWGETFVIRGLKVVSSVPLKGPDPGCDGIIRAAKAFEDNLPPGYVRARDLITKRRWTPAYEGMAVTLGALDAPLCGWMIQLRSYQGKHRISLISPGNDRGFALGSLPIEGSTCVYWGEHGCLRRGSYDKGSLAGVALTPDRAMLYVAITALAGGHHTPSHAQRATLALPAGVVPSAE